MTLNPQADYSVIAIQDPTNHSVFLTKRALTLKTHPGEFCFPGGRIEQGEDSYDAALRELFEETSATQDNLSVIKDVDPSRITTITTYTSNKTFAVCYATVCNKKRFNDCLEFNPDEVSSAQWFEPSRCRIVKDNSNRGTVKVVDIINGEYVEGATADVVAQLFSNPLST